MSKWARFIGGAAVLGAFAVGLAWWKGPELGFFKPKPFPVVLPADTEVQLMLLKPLDSGESQVGERVPCLVAEDVKSPSGYVVIPKGAGALIEVTRARQGSALGVLANQPARLEVKFISTLAVDKTPVELGTGSEKESLEVTYDMTEKGTVVDVVKNLWNHSETQESLKSLNNVFATGEWKAPDLKKALEDVAVQSEMPQTAQALKSDESWKRLSETAGKVAGGDLSGLSGGDAVLALGALREIGRVTGSVTGFLQGAIKGRNLTLPVGSVLKAKTSQEEKITYTPPDPRAKVKEITGAQ